MDWKWMDSTWKRDNDYSLECKEQHYHHDGSEWIVNGGTTRRGTLSKEQIWYYAQNGGECIGCANIEILRCLEMCIRDSVFADCPCGSDSFVSWPTSAPSLPTAIPSNAPSNDPSQSPMPLPT